MIEVGYREDVEKKKKVEKATNENVFDFMSFFGPRTCHTEIPG